MSEVIDLTADQALEMLRDYYGLVDFNKSMEEIIRMTPHYDDDGFAGVRIEVQT